MFGCGFRTPTKITASHSDSSLQKEGSMTSEAGPSSPCNDEVTSVTKTPEDVGGRSTEPPKSPHKPRRPSNTAISGNKTQPTQESAARILRALTGTPKSPPQPPKAKPINRAAEAKACLIRAKTLLGESRNLKADIKAGVTQALDRLYRLIVEASGASGAKEQPTSSRGKASTESEAEQAKIGDETPQTVLMKELLHSIQEHKVAITESQQHTLALSAELKQIPKPSIDQTPTYAEVTKLSSSIADLRKDLSGLTAPQPVNEEPTRRPAKSNTAALYSIIVTSDDVLDTSQELITKIKVAVDATNTGMRVDRLRKAKDQKVIIGCHSKDEMARVRKVIEASDLKVKEAQSRDPLILVRDVLSYHTDEEVVKAIKRQNDHLLAGVEEQDIRVAVKYRRKTRNPHAAHIVMQVSPKVWQRLTTAGRLHIDLQRLRVVDQSPLVQCSLCLGYGHSRRLCNDTLEKCSHCGGPHKWAACEDRLVGVAPTCCNCSRAKIAASGHNAFHDECPIRRKWDALARATTAYC